MMHEARAMAFLWVATLLVSAVPARCQVTGKAAQSWPEPRQGDFVVRDFRFLSGESLPELRIHFYTLGKPVKHAVERTTNAVLILHGTGGSGSTFFRPIFPGVLFGPGQLPASRATECVRILRSTSMRT